ncbi:hypothetical protein NBRC116493_31050 [Aurantivibrio infirmus]
MILANKTVALRSIQSAIFVLFLLTSGFNYSQNTSTQQGARLTSSGGFEYDNKTGVVIFKDDVVFEQGTLKITADKATVKRNAKNEIEKIVALGSPATFQQKPGENQPLIIGTGDVIEYEIVDGIEKVFIIGDANFKQDGSESKCDRYEINITAQTSSGSNNCEAVWTTAEPKIPTPAEPESDSADSQ